MQQFCSLDEFNLGKYVHKLAEVSQDVYWVRSVDYKTAKDVTQEKEPVNKMEQAIHYFRFFAEKIPAVFWVRDNSYNKQIYLSPGYEKIWGRSRESLYKNPDSWLDTLHPDDRADSTDTERFRTLEEVGYDAQYEKRYRILKPDGSVSWIKDTSFPIQDENDVFIGFAGIAEDITKEVHYEQAMREAKEKAESANQVKSDFLAMISHEIRTPLNAILGMSQILKSKGLSSELQEYVDIITGAGNSLLSLVSDILDFARLEAGKLSFSNEPFDLHALVKQTVHGLLYQAREKGIKLDYDFDINSPNIVVGDHNRVRQVIVNLLSNAIKFTDDGSVKLTIQCKEKTESNVVFDMCVKDTGIGIRAENVDKLFEKFSQIDSIYNRKHRGIGLGLAITRQLVEAMGGKIEAKSIYNEGSEFRFTLNLELHEDQVDKIHLLSVQQQKQSNLEQHNFQFKVLLIEDNVINQKIAKIILEDFNCQVDVANNGKEVLSRVDEIAGYDLIFMDIGLPDLSGFEIASKLREHQALQHLPIIAMTAHILDRDKEQALASGMNRVVAKPISYESIRAILDEFAKRVEKRVA
jgi:PAS domain S-box-containing protein